MNELMSRVSPIADMDCSFRSYLNSKKAHEAAHMKGNGIPDYAYGMDYELRKKLDSIPGLYKVARSITSTIVHQQMQIMNQQAVCATPTSFPDVYEIGCECARRLGIAVSNIFIVNDQTLNAYTYACDDVEPFIVLHSGLYERMTPGELKSIIGHECGHIQNYHGSYETIATLIAQEGLSALGGLSAFFLSVFTTGVQLALNSWSRAAEVTCDRAGLICADNLEDALSAEAKLMYGGAFGDHKIDYASIEEQLELQMSNATKYYEALYSHPTSARRIMAIREFYECQTFYDWRPDMRKADSILRSHKECDERCKKFINLTEEGTRSKRGKENE